MNIVVEKVLIVDKTHKIAKLVRFKEGKNLITSDVNSVGKSVIMKSIYHSLGADCAFDSNLDSEKLLFEIEFLFGEKKYTIIRYQNSFVVLINGLLSKHVKSGERILLSNFYYNEMGMSVFLKGRKNATEIAPPAYLFIPYYLDQDRSWKEEQEPFSKRTMGQYDSLSRNDLYCYHLGIYKDSYGKLKSDFEKIVFDIANEEKSLSELDNSYNKVKASLKNETIIQNTEELESVYRYNSKIINDLLEQQSTYLSELHSADLSRSKCLIRIREIKEVITKIKENKEQISKVVTCPNCGTDFDVDLHDEMKEIYNSVFLKNEIKTLEEEREQLDEQIDKIKTTVNDIAITLAKKNEELSKSKANYEEYVTRKSLSFLLDGMLTQIGMLTNKKSLLEEQKKQKRILLNSIVENANKAKKEFCETYCRFLNQLDVNFNASAISAFNKMKLSGSLYVRSTLAFYFAFLATKKEYNPLSFNWPLIIDSPREGEQDNVNSANILDFILSQNVGDYQCIVASVNATDYIPIQNLESINVIKIDNEKHSVLNLLDYQNNEEEIENNFAYFKRIP